MRPQSGGAPVLLIDEIDRTDEPFEAFLLEALSEFQVTIPELGTIKAPEPPIVILTSNRTREVHDALKRRCLYHWVDYPDFDREIAILQARAPEAAETLSREVVAFVQALRTEDLFKKPGVAETIDWAKCLLALDVVSLSPEVIADTMGALLKYQDDIARLHGSEAKRILDDARARSRPPDVSSGLKYPRGVWGADSPPRRAMTDVPTLELPDDPKLTHNITHFARALRAAGLPVGPGRVIDAVRAVAVAGFTSRQDFFYTLRACLVTRPEHLVVFAQIFRLYWRDPRYLEHMMAMMLPAIRGVQEERGCAGRRDARGGGAARRGGPRPARERVRCAGRGDGGRDRRHRDHVARGAAARARFRADVHRRDGAGETDARAARAAGAPAARRGAGSPTRTGGGSMRARACARRCGRGARCGGCTTRPRASAGPVSWCFATFPAR